MGRIEQIVDSRIAGRKVVVFSKTNCTFSAKAKRALYKYVDDGTLARNALDVMEIDGNPACQDIQDYLQALTGGRTVPRVFIDRKFVGGGDDIVDMDRSGELRRLLSTRTSCSRGIPAPSSRYRSCSYPDESAWKRVNGLSEQHREPSAWRRVNGECHFKSGQNGAYHYTPRGSDQQHHHHQQQQQQQQQQQHAQQPGYLSSAASMVNRSIQAASSYINSRPAQSAGDHGGQGGHGGGASRVQTIHTMGQGHSAKPAHQTSAVRVRRG